MEDIEIGKALLGLSSAIAGAATIVLYTSINAKARKRGARKHWGIGLAFGTAGMFLTFAGWTLLCLSRPSIDLGLLHPIGVAVAVTGGFLYLLSARRVGRIGRPARYSLSLHTGGIYAHLRHPQALALCVLALGLGPASGSIPYTVTLPLWIAFWTLYTVLEEKNELIPAFGEDYRRYMETVPRLIPRLLPHRSARETGEAEETPAVRGAEPKGVVSLPSAGSTTLPDAAEIS